MNYDEIKERLAPCGLHCGKCFAFTGGDIKSHSSRLKDSLGNFNLYAGRFADLLEEPVFHKYPDFKEFLDYLSTVECRGCRKEHCRLFISCKVRDCHVRKGVDFCFQCNNFPCHDTGFDEHLHKRYMEINRRMKETGVVAYYAEIRNAPRY